MTEIQNEKQFKESISKGSSVVHFWADWCSPCKDLDVLCQKLVSGTNLKYFKVEAETLSSISESENITVVPTFKIFSDSKLLVSIEGANPQELVKQIQQVAKNTKTESLEDKLKRLVTQDNIVLFMKGSPDQPKCGFSAKIVGILNENSIKFTHFDILQDQEVREGLKKFSNWPTFPQLYSKGKLIGGLDIVKELADEGELLSSLGIEKSESLDDKLKRLTTSSPVVLFMKGSPDQPKCGFSAKIVGILNNNSVKFSHFDILQDQEVREGLKKYSNWPTYPQLYSKGKLIGGLDIVKELDEDGELLNALL